MDQFLNDVIVLAFWAAMICILLGALGGLEIIVSGAMDRYVYGDEDDDEDLGVPGIDDLEDDLEQ